MIDLKNYGLEDWMIKNESDGITARVTAVHKERYELICTHGQTYGKLKGGIYYNNTDENYPAVGDFVMIYFNPDGDSQIIKTLDRKTVFTRNTYGRDKLGHSENASLQVIASNFDYVFILQSLNHDFNIKRMERYITLSWQSGATPVIILTKADLIDDYSELLNEVQDIAIGIDIFIVSSVSGYGIEDLENYLKPGKTAVFLGSSGVGKSSLLNALKKEDIMKVSQIREDDSRGRHTTTHRQMVMLDSGVLIIDTPGMRELGMWDVSQGLNEAFSDIDKFLGLCKFRDCNHQSEPGCAIKRALENGELSIDRWNSYMKLKKEAMYADDKEEYIKSKTKWHKDISKWKKQNKKFRKIKKGFEE